MLVGGAELEAAPLAVHEVVGEEEQGSPAGLHALRDAVRDGVAHGEVAEVHAQLVVSRACWALGRGEGGEVGWGGAELLTGTEC